MLRIRFNRVYFVSGREDKVWVFGGRRHHGRTLIQELQRGGVAVSYEGAPVRQLKASHLDERERLISNKGELIMSDEKAKYIYVASITLRNGKRIFASSYGLKAFRIKVKSDS